MERTTGANPTHATTSSGGVTRRRALRDIGAAGLALGGFEALLGAAAEAAPKHGTLADIDHVVILIQENRSFDHYFGTYAGVRGFGDKHGHKHFFQKDLTGKTVTPWRLPQECLPDITHNWGPQHRAWNHGAMNRFVIEHQKSDTAAVGLETMGYYDDGDVDFYHALANAFTICDGYHCSVIGPTDPNRLMSMSGTIDPAGKHGGPLLQTNISGRTGRFSWPTMPESLDHKGVSWKVYTDPAGGVLDNVLTYFKQYSPGSKLYDRALNPTYSADFLADVAANRLPKVSWLLASIADSEHPLYSTAHQGSTVARQVVEALISNPKVWKRTALFITWDENGGFFDHVAPPVAPKGTPGEYLTVSKLPDSAEGIRGPIGLGFRVPMIVVSPFSRGGLVCSDTFDHTSTLRFLERRFGAKVPNLSTWRRKHTGDLTSAFNFAGKPRYEKPKLPVPGGSIACAPTTVTYKPQPFPKQKKGTRRRPSGIVR
jgi:phospholipase C